MEFGILILGSIGSLLYLLYEMTKYQEDMERGKMLVKDSAVCKSCLSLENGVCGRGEDLAPDRKDECFYYQSKSMLERASGMAGVEMPNDGRRW